MRSIVTGTSFHLPGITLFSTLSNGTVSLQTTTDGSDKWRRDPPHCLIKACSTASMLFEMIKQVYYEERIGIL